MHTIATLENSFGLEESGFREYIVLKLHYLRRLEKLAPRIITLEIQAAGN